MSDEDQRQWALAVEDVVQNYRSSPQLVCLRPSKTTCSKPLSKSKGSRGLSRLAIWMSDYRSLYQWGELTFEEVLNQYKPTCQARNNE